MASIERTLGPDTKTQILRALTLSGMNHSAEELERVTTKGKATIYQALEDLRDEKAMKVVQTNGKKKYYKLRDVAIVGGVPAADQPVPSALYHLFRSELNQYGLQDLPAYPVNVIFDFKKKLLDKYEGISHIILFGSAARGTYSVNSDLDFYIVHREEEPDLEAKIRSLARSYDHEFSIIIRNTEKYENDFEKPMSDLADNIVNQGHQFIYGDSSLVDRYIDESFKKSSVKRQEDSEDQ